MSNRNWQAAPLDIDFLLDSGLLFEINRTTLHILGIALTVKVDGEGKKRFELKDCRSEPERLVYDKGTQELGKEKLRSFMAAFGGKQLDRRRAKLGWAYQPDKL